MGIENTNGVIKGSLMVIHTCEPEGFPNVFLQAWAFEKPVISLHFDPGGYLKSHQTGFHSKSFEQMKEDVIFMLNHENDRITLGENAKKLIENNFIKSENVKKLIDFYHKILETA
jgi:glycosyltransferase involved in cell wall biosynthesis